MAVYGGEPCPYVASRFSTSHGGRICRYAYHILASDILQVTRVRAGTRVDCFTTLAVTAWQNQTDGSWLVHTSSNLNRRCRNFGQNIPHVVYQVSTLDVKEKKSCQGLPWTTSPCLENLPSSNHPALFCWSTQGPIPLIQEKKEVDVSAHNMTRTRERSPSLDLTSGIKRIKTYHDSAHGAHGDKPQSCISQFVPELSDHSYIARLRAGYLTNEPYKFAVVDKLFQDELLKKVKDECLSELSFSQKETDIYKVWLDFFFLENDIGLKTSQVNQTGDLASLNYLTTTQISLLPNLLTLRDALYSSAFRNFLQTVTDCGPLSGQKQDMSVNSYTKGCHLLNHDDVIGTRRVSYILYMPLPHYTMWQKEWGGALELYPAQMGENGQMEPEPVPTKSIPPSWNQFIFFEVQPGRSFHSVEEVVVGGEGEDGRERLSISGWFHAAQEGEEGYVPEPQVPEVKSSREQLVSKIHRPSPHPLSSWLYIDLNFDGI
jgi:Rps23 Pro-64 3,4-dihydroxylase Tpa1-like proline 4-hydroxylase